MKKIISITLILFISICTIFAAKSDIVFSNFGNVQVFNKEGQPVDTSVLNSGDLVKVFKSRAVLKLEDNRIITIDPNSAVSVVNDDLNDIQLYLVSGSLSTKTQNNGKFTIYTGVSKYWTDQNSAFELVSNYSEEKIKVDEGRVYTIYSGDNTLRAINKGQTYSIFSNEPKKTIENTPVIAPVIIEPKNQTPVKEEPKTETPVIQEPVKPIENTPVIAPVIIEPTPQTPVKVVEPTPITPIYQGVMIGIPYIREIKPESQTPAIQENKTETPKAEEPEKQTPINLKPENQTPAIQENKTEAPSTQQPIAETPIENSNDSAKYVKNAFDFGLRAVGMTTIDGTHDFELLSLNFGVNPYFEFANSRLEFRLLWHTEVYNHNKILHPWNNLSFRNATEAIKSVGNFIHDIKIEDFLIISRQRQIPLSITSLNLKNRPYNFDKLPLYANIDLTYVKINAYAEDLLNIKDVNVLKAASLSIIPSQSYKADLTFSIIHNPMTLNTTSLNPELILGGNIKLPIVSIFSVGVHGGLPFLYKNATKIPKSFYVGLDFYLEVGGLKLLFGADYSQKRVFTNYMNMTNNSIWSLYNVGTKDTEGLNAITPYFALDFNTQVFGVEINAAYPFYLGNTRPWSSGSAYSSWKYNLDARLNIFVQPFADSILRIGAEWNTYNLFKNGFSNPNVPLSNFAIDWFPTFTVTSEHGPIFMRGQFDLKRASNDSPMMPVLSLMMSVKVGSDYVFNPTYIALRNEKENNIKKSGRFVLKLDVQDNILFAKNAWRDRILGSQIILQPIIGFEHPNFAILAKYKFTNFDFSEWNTYKDWGVGKWIDTFLYKFNVFNVLKIESAKTFAIKDSLSPIYKQSVLPTLTLDLDIAKILTIQIPYMSTNLDNVVKNKNFNGITALLGYRSDFISAYLTTIISGNWNIPSSGFTGVINIVDSYLALNVDFNIKGWRGGAFFGTTVTHSVNSSGNRSTAFGLTKGGWGEDQNDMLVGGMFGYRNKLFHAELTGGAQINRATFRYNDGLTKPSVISEGVVIDNFYEVTDRGGHAVKGKFIPFFNFALGVNASDIFIFNIDYTLNISPKFNELYRDRLSAQIKIITPVIDINGVLEKRGAFTGGETLKKLWSETYEISKGTELAYKVGIDIKTDLAIFAIEFENRFFGKTLKDEEGYIRNANCLTLKTSIGLL